MSERAPYSRVYWSVMDDPKFDGIRDDIRLLGSWLLLLLAADMAHPASASLTRTVPQAAVTRLAGAGLIDLLDGHRYRVHGLDAERDRRRIAATTRGPSGDRPVPKRDPNGQQDETRRDETSKDETTRASDDDGRADLEAFLVLRRRAPTAKQRKLLDEVMDRHDLTGPAWAADLMYRHPDDPIGAVIEADKAWRATRIAEAQAAEKPKPKPRRAPNYPQSAREILDAWTADVKRDPA